MSDPTQIGHYLIKGLLRHGRSADSYFAENAAMRSQKVLLRVLHEDTASDPSFVRSFMEEARIAARLDHNCIASVLDLKDDGERIYAVLEFIEGLDLAELLEQFGPPPPEVAAAIMREVCSALEHAHGKSILHRRLRPRLVKVTPEGGVKVLGFGLRERESYLQSAVMPDALREELYRPPEQVREEPQDVRGDLYTLAVIIFELLTRRLPFDTITGPAGRGALRKPPQVYGANPLVPAAFGRLLERMLSERREDRPNDAGEVRRSLDDLLDEYRVLHAADLLSLYLGNPPDYTEQAKKRSLEHMLHDAERLSKGSEAERRAAIEELERVLVADPNHKQAQSLVRKLRPGLSASTPPQAASPPQPAGPAFDPNMTMVDTSGTAGELARAAAAPPTPSPPAKPSPAPRLASVPRAVVPISWAASRPAPPMEREHEPEPRPSRRIPIVGIVVGVVALTVIWTLFFWRPWAPKVPDLMSPDSTAIATAEMRLDVETNPPGAQVTLPGTGETRVSPTWFEHIRPGATRVHVALGGYLTRDTTIELTLGEPGALRLDLVSISSLPCTLFVQVTPRADRVVVDGLDALARDSSSWFAIVQAGTHSVEITAAGYETWDRSRAAKVDAGANARLAVTLRPGVMPPGTETATGTGTTPGVTTPQGGDRPWEFPSGTKVTVECVPEAQLIVDGVAYPTLVKRADLSMGPGEHRFRFVHPDYVESVQFKKLKKGQRSEKIRQDFRIGHGILSISAPASGQQVWMSGKFRGYTNLIVRDVEPGRVRVELRDRAGLKVLATKDVIVANSSVPIEVKF